METMKAAVVVKDEPLDNREDPDEYDLYPRSTESLTLHAVKLEDVNNAGLGVSHSAVLVKNDSVDKCERLDESDHYSRSAEYRPLHTVKSENVNNAPLAVSQDTGRMGPKGKNLSCSDKLNIIRKIHEGKALNNIAKEYGVTGSAIGKIKKRKAEIEAFAASGSEELLKKKSMKAARNKYLDEATFMWFHQRRCLGEPISGPLLCEKALILNNKINGSPSFRASNGWLEKFKNRHGIRQLSIQGEKLSSDTEAAKTFIVEFNTYVKKAGYTTDNIYNADETGLNWKSLPRKVLASGDGTTAPGRRDSKDRVTVLCCSNASGTHKIPMLLIGKSKKPRCFENVPWLPVIYKAEKNAWMDRAVFMDWYGNDFIPIVKKRQENTGRKGKVLLLLDNALSHPLATTLNAVDENFGVMFLPPNITAIIQPMCQGVTEITKRKYRKSLLRRLLSDENTHLQVDTFIKKLTIKDCCDMIASAWNSLTNSNLRKAWKVLISNNSIAYDDSEEVVSTSTFTSAFNQIPDSNVSEEDVLSWLNEDKDDHGWEQLTDDDIIAAVTQKEIASAAVDLQEELNDKFTDEELSPREAFTALDNAYKWMEKQAECTANDLIALNNMRELAAKKSFSCV